MNVALKNRPPAEFVDPRAKIFERGARNVSEIIRRIFDLVNPIGESPIERLLFCALAIEIKTTWLHDLSLIVTPAYQRASNHAEIDCAAPFKILLESQIEVAGARVDFMATVINGAFGRYRSLVIECDGHDFHERTKEQAKRDRERDRTFQALGHTVYRFTGSEINADPIACANQIIRWAVDTIHPAIEDG